VLYVSIAVSGWLVWRKGGIGGAALALSVYASQLVLNGLWAAVFFGLRRPDLALLEIVCLWLSILATIAVFHQVDELAAYLLVPYACWVSFAVVSNFRVWHLNPALASCGQSAHRRGRCSGRTGLWRRTQCYLSCQEPKQWRNGLISRADVEDFLIKQVKDVIYLKKVPVLAY
jgi:hypothetical protein